MTKSIIDPEKISPDGTDPGDGYAYPTTVAGSAVAAFLAAIGVDPVDLRTMRSLHIEPHGVRFERFRVMDRSTRGTPTRRGPYATADHPDAEPAGQVTTARIDWSA